MAAAAEHPSEHPLGAAIVRATRARGLILPAVTSFAAQPGRGVTATIDDQVIAVGSPAAMLPHLDHTDAATASDVVAVWEGRGHTAVIVTCDHRLVGVIAIADELRPEAAAAITAATQLLGMAVRSSRITTASAVCKVRSDPAPPMAIPAWAAARNVTIVGDGINDAPAPVIALSRRARRVVATNLIIAATFIAALVIWDLAGTLPLPLGVAGHEGSTVIVGLNGLRLLRDTVRQLVIPVLLDHLPLPRGRRHPDRRSSHPRRAFGGNRTDQKGYRQLDNSTLL